MLYRLLRRLDSGTRRSSAEVSIGAARLYDPDAAPTPEIERQFFAGIRLANGTFKTTSDRRLDDLNQEILRHLSRNRAINAKDVAMSSGISTVEWYETLRAGEISCQITATDLLIHARLVRLPGELVLLLDRDGELLQIDVAGFAFRPDQIGSRERVLYGLPIAVARRTARRAQRGGRLHFGLNGRTVISDRRIELVTRRLAACPDIKTREEDLLAPPVHDQQWDLIRAANVLNLGYFAESTLREIIANLAQSLAEGGMLAICRTVPDLGNQASVFQRTGGSFDLLGELGGGSEVRDLVLAA